MSGLERESENIPQERVSHTQLVVTDKTELSLEEIVDLDSFMTEAYLDVGAFESQFEENNWKDEKGKLDDKLLFRYKTEQYIKGVLKVTFFYYIGD